jgi:hypothetical protein
MAKRKSNFAKQQEKHRAKRFTLWKFFHLHPKKAFFVACLWALAIIFHNFSQELFGINEPVFFLIAVVLIPLYFIAMIIHTFVDYVVTHNQGRYTKF